MVVKSSRAAFLAPLALIVHVAVITLHISYAETRTLFLLVFLEFLPH